MTHYIENSLDVPLHTVLAIIQSRIMTESTYFGVKAQKSPTDYWIYQEIIFRTKPDVIIEIGNKYGGTVLALAHICDLLGKGRVIGIDLTHEIIPDIVKNHPRVTLIEGDACKAYKQVCSMIAEQENVMVIEDSSHTYENTLSILQYYSALIKPGDYFIVEDSICHHGLEEGPSPGPYEAIEAFLDGNMDFEIDRSKESFLITWNPKGYLRRKENDEVPHSVISKQLLQKKFSSVGSIKKILKLIVPPIIVQVIRKIRVIV